MPEDEVDILRRWARGDFYPLSPQVPGPNALNELAVEMGREPIVWWRSLRALLLELDQKGVRNLNLPFAALLDVGGEQLVNEVASIANREPKVANEFWDAMESLRRSSEAYRRLGRRQTIEAFIRHVPRSPGHQSSHTSRCGKTNGRATSSPFSIKRILTRLGLWALSF